MFKPCQAIMAVLAATTIGGSVINFNCNSAPLTIHAATLTPAPWETDVDSHLPIVQTLHNGNEIYYSLSGDTKVDTAFNNAVAA